MVQPLQTNLPLLTKDCEQLSNHKLELLVSVRRHTNCDSVFVTFYQLLDFKQTRLRGKSIESVRWTKVPHIINAHSLTFSQVHIVIYENVYSKQFRRK